VALLFHHHRTSSRPSARRVGTTDTHRQPRCDGTLPQRITASTARQRRRIRHQTCELNSAPPNRGSAWFCAALHGPTLDCHRVCFGNACPLLPSTACAQRRAKPCPTGTRLHLPIDRHLVSAISSTCTPQAKVGTTPHILCPSRQLHPHRLSSTRPRNQRPKWITQASWPCRPFRASNRPMAAASPITSDPSRARKETASTGTSSHATLEPLLTYRAGCRSSNSPSEPACAVSVTR